MTIWDPGVETMSRAEMRELQGTRLRSQLRYVAENSEFYRRKFDQAGVALDDIRGVDDLSRLPFTIKEELRESQDASPPFGAHVSASPRDIVWLPSTSGTTGTPLLLPRTARDIETWTQLNARAFTIAGLNADDIYQNILGYHWIYGGHALHQGAQRVGATVINAGMGDTAKQLWALRYLGVTAFHATPSYLIHLGKRIAEAGLRDSLGVRLIIGGAEVGMATDEAKEHLREYYPRVQTFADVGGVTDVGTMIWAECPEGAGGHLAEDSIIWEVLDPETDQPVAPGEIGELVFTDVVSDGAPLIRYRVRDLARIVVEPCGCGRTTARLAGGILGRSDDMLTVRGANVYPSAVDRIVKSVTQLDGEYQVVVDRDGDLDILTLRVEIARDVDAEGRAQARRALEERFRVAIGSRIDVELLELGSLPSFTYKAQRIIDRRRGQSEDDAWQRSRDQQQ